jgi:hypothetical protein
MSAVEQLAARYVEYVASMLCLKVQQHLKASGLIAGGGVEGA